MISRGWYRGGGIRLRKSNPALVYGGYEVLGPEHPHVYAYRRKLGDEEWTVVLNFSGEEQVWGEFSLRPYEARIGG
jgi:glycosidase